MVFLFNKQEVCPHCRCEVIVAESIGVSRGEVLVHCNGGRWEYRTFLCGYSCEYVPNFSRVEPRHSCQNAPTYKATEKQRAVLRKQIQDLEEQLRSIDM